MNELQASVIIAFYNNIKYLDLVMAGFARQSDNRFQIIIADDGSGKDAVERINKITPGFPFSVKHLWHEDKGWRKNIILNKSIVSSDTDYLIFCDADCIPHRHFIREHLRNRSRNIILSGRRVNLSESISQNLDTGLVAEGYLEKNIVRWLVMGLKGEFTHAEKGLYLPMLTRYLTKKDKGLLGCNFSIYKEDLVSLNGFDERYLAPAVGEDTDLEYRSGRAGMKIKSVRNLAIQYHLYHPKLSRESDNMSIFEDTKAKGYQRTPFGILKENAL